MLLTYQAVPKEEATQTGVQYDIHIAELCIPLDSKTDAIGPKKKRHCFSSLQWFFFMLPTTEPLCAYGALFYT